MSPQMGMVGGSHERHEEASRCEEKGGDVTTYEGRAHGFRGGNDVVCVNNPSGSCIRAVRTQDDTHLSALRSSHGVSFVPGMTSAHSSPPSSFCRRMLTRALFVDIQVERERERERESRLLPDTTCILLLLIDVPEQQPLREMLERANLL